jgi:hypothetical protein
MRKTSAMPFVLGPVDQLTPVLYRLHVARGNTNNTEDPMRKFMTTDAPGATAASSNLEGKSR